MNNTYDEFAGDIDTLANGVVNGQYMTPRLWLSKYGDFSVVKSALPKAYHELSDDFKETRTHMLSMHKPQKANQLIN